MRPASGPASIRLNWLGGWLLMLGLPLVVAALAAASPFQARLEAWLQDATQRLVAGEQHFDDVLVVAVDEASLSELRPYLGGWPYPRDVYAVLLDYLGEMQVRSVFFDILFAEHRPGDDAFRAALARNPAARLAATARRSKPAEGGDPALLGRLAWPADPAADLPAMHWQAAALPLTLLTDVAALPRIGLISVDYDADGMLRRIPLLHRVGDDYLPSGVLAMLHDGDAAPRLAYREGWLTVDDAAWPVAADGTVALRFPANADAVDGLPFATLVQAALGLPGHAVDPARLRGKALFIGTTALFADHVNTPNGVVNGVQLLATAYGALRRGQYLAPPSLRWNAALLLCGLLPVVAAFAVRAARQRRIVVVSGASIAALAVILSLHLGLLAAQQASWLGLPLLTALAASVLALAYVQQRRANATAATARAEVEQQREVLALVSHELKSPLAAIDMTLQNLARVDGLPSAVQARHQRIHRASRRLQALIDDNLAADRLRRDKAGLQVAGFDLAGVIGEVVEAAERPGIHVELPSAQAAMQGDRELMRIVCANLVGNAVKYSPSGAPIHIGLVREGSGWTLSVSDRGDGIAEADLARIFEPYVRAAGTRQPGSGLGLALVRQIVERHRGTVAVESAPGVGTRFVVRLPAGVNP